MKVTTEIDLPEFPVEAGKVYRVGDPAFFEIFVLVERVERYASGTWSIRQTLGEKRLVEVVPKSTRVRVSGIIQQGWVMGLRDMQQEVQPGTRWETDGQWRFELVEWTQPPVAEVFGPPTPPTPSWFIRPD